MAGLVVLGVWQLVATIGDGGDRNARVGSWDNRRPSVEADTAALKVLADEWNDRISTDTFWRGRRSNSSSNSGSSIRTAPSRLQGPPEPPSWFATPAPGFWGQPGEQQTAPRSPLYGGLRTICVRTCDGYFFPVSFSASEGNLGRDQATCSNACPGARLFYSRVRSDEIDDMVDLNGQRYSKLPNANLFRTQYVDSCKCKPHAWEEASIERHRIYALEDRRRKGDRSVVAELENLKSKRKLDERVMRGNRNSSRSRNRMNGEKASLPVPTRSADAGAVLAAPRSDASRGQGGLAGMERVASVAITTGSVALSRTITDVGSLPATAAQAAIDQSVVAGTLMTGAAAAAAIAAASAAEVTPESLAGTPSRAPASAAVTREQNAEATPDALPATPAAQPTAARHKPKVRQAQRQRPDGVTRLGAAQQSPASRRVASPGRPSAQSGNWVRQVFSF